MSRSKSRELHQSANDIIDGRLPTMGSQLLFGSRSSVQPPEPPEPKEEPNSGEERVADGEWELRTGEVCWYSLVE